MSAEAIVPSPLPGPTPGLDTESLVGRSVDIFDLAAHLEANGQGDARARLAGHADVFAFAHVLVATINAGATALSDRKMRSDLVKRTARRRVHNAVYRVVTMLTGVVICLGISGNQPDPGILFVTGAVGWLLTQVVSSAVWSGLGAHGRACAADDGIVSATSALVVGAVVAVAVGSAGLLAWAGWSIALAVVAVLDDVRRLAASATAAAVLVVLAQRTGLQLLPMTLALLAVSLALARGAWILVTTRETRLPRLSRGARSAIGYAVIQTGGQILVLWFLLLSLGPASFAAVALAGLVAGAVADPVLEIAQAAVYTLVRSGVGWVKGRRRALLIGLGAVGAVMLSALVTVVAHRSYFADPAGYDILIACALTISALVAGTGVLLRSGSARGAATLSAVGAAAVGTATLLGPGSLPAAAAVAVALAVFSCALGAREMASPLLW